MHQAQHGVKAIDDVERFVRASDKNEGEADLRAEATAAGHVNLSW
jgi:hypothetical protein